MKNNKLENGKNRREFIGDIAKGFGALAIGSTLNLNLLANVPTNQTAEKFGFIIHGGAGTLEKSQMTPALEREYRAKLTEALTAGYNVIVKNGAALDAVETAIHILEDSPLFNAGKGAVFTAAGTNELDASIMDGSNLMAGAVGDVQHIKNPISLARLVMEKSPHVMLVGEGAETFAKQNGVTFVPQSYFRTEQRWQEYLQDKANDEKQKQKQSDKKAKAVSVNYVTINDKHGTVGAAALDKMGNLAAGTSTGGLSYKRFGRIGDSPIIGAGTYANNDTCAISATGDGEYFIRLGVARDISALMEYGGKSIEEAAQIAIGKVGKLGGTGGVVGIDKNGNFVEFFNTDGMYRGRVGTDGKMNIQIYKN